MNFLYWLVAIPVLFVLILVHEIGHLIAARLMKVRVEEFGIGLPPRMLTLGERKGVKYTLNWLPIGGFVKLAGEEDPTVPGSLAGKKPWQRVIVLISGALMNLLLALLLFTGLAMYGHSEVVSRQVGIYRVEPGSPAALAGIQPGDIIVAINGREMKSYDDIQIETSLNRGITITMVLDRQGQTVVTSLVPRRQPPENRGPIGIYLSYYESPVTVQYVAPGSPAEKAGLRAGDIITAIDGRPIPDSLAYMIYIDAHFGEKLTLSVRRDGQDLPPVPLLNTTSEGLPMGIDYLRLAYRTYPLGQALAEGWQETIDAIVLIPRSLAGLLTGSVAVSDLSGPVGIVIYSAQVARLAGLYGLLRLMAIISVNLFLVNLFPIPALDGGRLVFVFLEWLRGGRRISPEKEGLVHMVFFFLLLGLLAVITYYDIARAIQSESAQLDGLLRGLGFWLGRTASLLVRGP